MSDFNELKSTNDYLVDQLICARRANEALLAANEGLVQGMADLTQLLDALVDLAGQFSS